MTRATLVFVLLISGCATAPKPLVIREPVKVCPEPTIVVKPVPRTLTAQELIPTGPLADAPHIAELREEAIIRANAKLCLIEKRHGNNPDLECVQ